MYERTKISRGLETGNGISFVEPGAQCGDQPNGRGLRATDHRSAAAVGNLSTTPAVKWWPSSM